MSDPTPAPAPRRRRLARWEFATLIVVAVVIALAYGLTALVYGRSASNRGLDIEASPPPGGVALSLEVIALDPGLSTLRARMLLEPADEFVDEAGQLTTPISVITNLTKDQVNYPVGQRPAIEEVTLFMDGSYEDYPLDQWVTGFAAIAFPTSPDRSTESTTILPVDVGFQSSVPGWVTRQISVEEFKSEVGDAQIDGPVSFVAVRFTRAGSTLAIVALVLLLMTALAALGVTVSLAVATGRRRVEPTLAGFMAALLFALIPLRTVLPGAPPLGAWIDFLVFFWVEIALMLGLILYVTTWLQHGPRPDAPARTSAVPARPEPPDDVEGTVRPGP